MKTLTVSLSDRKLRDLKQRAKEIGITPDEMVAELIRDHITGTLLITVER